VSEVTINALHVERPDPLWPNDGTEPFDFDEVDRRLAGEMDTMSRPEEEFAAFAVGRLMSWVSREGECRDLRTIGQRVVALMWTINPKGQSQGDVAKHFGSNPKLISRYAAEASRKFGIRNRFQAHASSGRQKAENPQIPAEKHADVK
jgi:hypothetical protein